MISILAVGEGRRDERVVPVIAQHVLGRPLRLARSLIWQHLRLHGRGFDKKLVFAIRSARADGIAGVVATVARDRDSAGDRLRQLQDGRRSDREKYPPIPTAIGSADPHLEAWLLDDAHAVRTALTSPSLALQGVAKTANPKKYLDAVLRDAEVSPLDGLEAITRAFDLSRCAHATKTGLSAFAADLRGEFESVGS